MTDAAGVTKTGWEYYYEVLKNNYNRFKGLGKSYPMQIQFTPQNGANPSVITVTVNGVQTYREENPNFGEGATHLSLQSHWGSGVTFSGISIQ